MNQSQTVHIVDDDDAVRRALSRLLEAAGYPVKSYSSAGEFLLFRGSLPGCILLDVRMPGPSGFDLQDAVAKLENPLPIVFLTAYGDIAMSVRAMKSGAVDFLTKPVQREALLSAVESAFAHDNEQRSFNEHLQKCRASFDGLTSREREVFERVVHGKLNKQIASELGMAERTVKAHRAHIMEKMHATSLAELVHFAETLERAHHPGGHSNF